MTSVTYEPAGRVGRARWLRVGWDVFLGYVLAALVLLPAVALAHVSGVYRWRQSPSRRFYVLDWPFPQDGLWSVLANLGAIALVLFVAALCISWSVRRHTGRPTPAGAVFACLVLTGYAPFALYDGPLGLREGVAFVATVVLVRWRAADSEWRLDRRGRGVVVRALAVAAVAFVSYGVSHPLFHASTVSIDGGEPRAAAFLLGNGSHADVALLGVEPRPAPFPGVEVKVGRGDAAPGATVRARGRLFVHIVPHCPAGASGFATLVWLDVRYRHLGWTRTQAIPLDRELRVTCP